MDKKKQLIINIVLALLAIFLGYKVVDSISQPVKFTNTKSEREKVVVQHLKDIRLAQYHYKQANNVYTASFDTLINFIKNNQIPEIRMVLDPNDTTFSKTINDTIGFVPVLDSLFGNRKDFNVDELNIVPFSQGVSFEMAAGFIKRGGINVTVFEAKTPYSSYLWDLDKQRVLNASASQEQINKYPGLKVGSMTEASTDGNWE